MLQKQYSVPFVSDQSMKATRARLLHPKNRRLPYKVLAWNLEVKYVELQEVISKVASCQRAFIARGAKDGV